MQLLQCEKEALNFQAFGPLKPQYLFDTGAAFQRINCKSTLGEHVASVTATIPFISKLILETTNQEKLLLLRSRTYGIIHFLGLLGVSDILQNVLFLECRLWAQLRVKTFLASFPVTNLSDLYISHQPNVKLLIRFYLGVVNRLRLSRQTEIDCFRET